MNFRKTILYGIFKKSTHGHTNECAFCTILRDIVVWTSRCSQGGRTNPKLRGPFACSLRVGWSRVGGWVVEVVALKKKFFVPQTYLPGNHRGGCRVANCTSCVRLGVSLGCPVTYLPISRTATSRSVSATASYPARRCASNGVRLPATGLG